MITETSIQTLRPDTKPVIITHQSQNGCVTSAAESLFLMFGFPYETNFLSDFRLYNIEPGNPNNNHMLGLVPVAIKKGFDVTVHIKPKFDDYVLPESAPSVARKIHPELLRQIELLSQAGKITLTGGHLNLQEFKKRVTEEVKSGKQAIVALDWKKWATVGQQMKKAQEKFGNPFHAIHLYSIDSESAHLVDPSLVDGENPVTVTLDQLYSSLHETQQMIFIGENKIE